MAKGDFVAYYRVSTQRQGLSGLGLDAQRKAVTDYLSAGGWTLSGEFTEVESGRKKNRLHLRLALAQCRRQKATLVIAKLDRLARNVAFISALLESKVRFVAVDMPDADAAFLQMAAVFAEWETKKISERTAHALEQAARRGKKLGWAIPDRCGQQHPAALKGAARNRDNARQFARNVIPIVAAIKAAGITTLDGIAAALNARGITTGRDGQWYATTARNILSHQAAA